MITIDRTSHTGAITYWTLANNSDLAKLRDHWAAVGMDSLLPERQEGIAVLRAALAEHCLAEPVLIRRLANRKALTVVREDCGDAENEYRAVLRAEIADDGSIRTTPDNPLIADRYAAWCNRLTAARLGSALAHVVSALGGITLRPAGGVYWLPAKALPDWATIAQGVETASLNCRPNTVYVLRTHADPETVRAVRDGLAAEIDAAVNGIAAELATGELQARAIDTRRQAAHGLRAKIRAYEAALGEALDTVRAKVDSIEQAAALAELALSAAQVQESEVSHVA